MIFVVEAPTPSPDGEGACLNPSLARAQIFADMLLSIAFQNGPERATEARRILPRPADQSEWCPACGGTGADVDGYPCQRCGERK